MRRDDFDVAIMSIIAIIVSDIGTFLREHFREDWITYLEVSGSSSWKYVDRNVTYQLLASLSN
jgi:hypothetical protein